MTGEFTIGVHALVYLNHKRETVSSEALAENVCTNPARVRKVMAMLKRVGLVDTKAGVDGGYSFRGDPERVTLRQIDDAVGVPIVSASWRSGSVDMECLIASGIADVLDGIYGELNQMCRDRLAQITIADIDRKIFGKNPKEKEERHDAI